MSSKPILIDNQVENFKQMIDDTSNLTWIGNSPKQWVQTLKIDFTEIESLSSQHLKRDELFSLWEDFSYSIEHCFLSTMAWGGMRAIHGRTIWKSKEEWLPICKKLRNSQFKNRKTAFNEFITLRHEKKLSGMGPAYFTKILFFAKRDHDAYILDQWTARSIHILTQNRRWPAVTTPNKNRAYVTDYVTPDDYENYCIIIEELSQILDKKPALIEQAMFGKGGNNPSKWRAYILKNWLSLPL